MSKRRRTSLWRIPPFVGASVFGHLVFVGVMAASGVTCGPLLAGERLRAGLTLGPAARHRQPIEVSMIEPRPLSPLAPRLEEQLEKERQQKIEEAKKSEESPDIDGQVVDAAKPPVEVRPDEAKFISEHDIKVEKETRGKVGKAHAGAREERRASPPPVPSPPEAGKTGAKTPGPLAMRNTSEKRPVGVKDAFHAAGTDGSEPAPGEEPRRSATTEGGGPAPEGSGEDRPPPSMSELRPSDNDVTRAVGGGSQDYLPDVDEGEETIINTKRWKYATFFNRVKRAVADNWHPDDAYRLRDPTGQIYGLKNRMTILKVSIAPDGALRDVLLEKPCGVDFLDDEAISAFKEAQPFPNPPVGLVDRGSNLITFRFGFFFEITGAPVFKVYRY